MRHLLGLIFLLFPLLVQAAETRIWNPYFNTGNLFASLTDEETAARNQINLRRGQVGLATLAWNGQLEQAARGHSNYLALNNITGHYQTAGSSGFTGADPGARITNAGYAWRGYDEVIAFGPSSGVVAVENLMEAIYHRFGIFSTYVDEIGSGFADTHPTYTYVMTADLATRNSTLPSPGANWVGVYPYNGETGVPIDFYSDEESPDPVPNANRVGYPISIHLDQSQTLGVTSFTVSANGSALPTIQLTSVDGHTPKSASAIIPTQALTYGTTYTANFSGTANGAALNKTWSFTTVPLSNISFSPASLTLAPGQTQQLKIQGGSGRYAGVGWSNGSVIKVAFVGTDTLQITALAPGSASITVTDSDNRQGSMTVNVATAAPAPSVSDADCVFNWAESLFPGYFPKGPPTETAGGYTFRHYAQTGFYLATDSNSRVIVHNGLDWILKDVGAVGDFLPQARASGC
ncbi:MAG: pilus assembly protein N-terminal domain-containing protein [Sulfuricellaceae bacterium]|nr:pilus assembly protein N-terminal domain-containing protein [Sulfuricellaceae bacterium]